MNELIVTIKHKSNNKQENKNKKTKQELIKIRRLGLRSIWCVFTEADLATLAAASELSISPDSERRTDITFLFYHNNSTLPQHVFSK